MNDLLHVSIHGKEVEKMSTCDLAIDVVHKNNTAFASVLVGHWSFGLCMNQKNVTGRSKHGAADDDDEQAERHNVGFVVALNYHKRRESHIKPP